MTTTTQDYSLRQSPRQQQSSVFGPLFWQNLAQEVVVTVAHSLVLFSALGLTLYSLDPNRTKKTSSKQNQKEIDRKLISNGRKPFKMTEQETVIALDLVYPTDLTTTFNDIGGLDDIKQEIYDLICLPLQRTDLFQGGTDLLRPPKGILLFGPPGTGKTMLAKAIAKESSAAFINLKISSLTDKWFGESEKLVRATFSLAWKLSPCIIFVDEIESFLRKRSINFEHQAIANMKAEFMALWDGLDTFHLSGMPDENVSFLSRVKNFFSFSKEKENVEKIQQRNSFGVVVIGATNRPGDIDEAVLRRMARTFFLGIPNSSQRLSILKLILSGTEISSSLSAALPKLSEKLEKYSGSDLKELCRAAAMIPLKEYSNSIRSIKMVDEQGEIKIRKLTLSDFELAMRKVLPTGESANEYQQYVDNKGMDRQDDNTLGNQQLMQLFHALMQNVPQKK